MKRLCLLLDEMAILRSALNNDAFDPVQLAVLAETAGVNGLACTYSGAAAGISERDLRLLVQMRKTFFNLRIPVEEEALRLALSLRPDMITFVDVDSSDPRTIRPISVAMHLEELEHRLPDLQANSISVAAFIELEINTLRNISKLPIDYVELNTADFTASEDINEEIINLDKIQSAAVAAAKLGMGVNCCGGIRYNHIPALANLPNIEDILIGKQIIEQAIWNGVPHAVREALQLIRHREID